MSQNHFFFLSHCCSLIHRRFSLISLPSSISRKKKICLLASVRVNKKKNQIIISSLGELHAYIWGIILISNGFIAHEIAYNGNLSMAYALIVFPWAEEETDGIRVRAMAGWEGWERAEWRGGAGCRWVRSSTISVCHAIMSPLHC